MAFRFLHSSDWHLGASRNLTRKKLDYLDRHKKVLKEVLKVASEERVNFILISGDIFENANTTIEEFIAAYEIFTEAGQIAPVIVTSGNHDELSVGKFQTEWLNLLSIPNVHFISKPEVITLGTPIGDVQIAAIPWTGIKVQEEFETLVSQYTGPQVEICMLHECFLGVTLDTGLSSKSGVKIPDISNVRYYALGDIHKYQKCQLPNAWYSGAPMQYNFGDGLPKGVIVVDVDLNRNYTPRFIPIPSSIELHNISSLDQIPEASPHWYKLRCEASKLPRHLPDCIKVTEPVAVSLSLPKAVLADNEKVVHSGMQAVDFTEGVEELLLSNGFDVPEINQATEEITKLVYSL